MDRNAPHYRVIPPPPSPCGGRQYQRRVSAKAGVLAARCPAPRSLQVVLHLFVVGATSGAILSLIYTMVFISQSLSVMVDAFCCDIVGVMHMQDVSRVWNTTQAMCWACPVGSSGGFL